MTMIGKRIFVATVIMAMLLAFGTAAYAVEIRSIIIQQLKINNDINQAVRFCIREGFNARETCRTAIALGHSACTVVKASLSEGGDLEQTLLGALDAGASSDIIAGCAIDAGAKPQLVSLVLNRSDFPATDKSGDSGPSVSGGQLSGGRGGRFVSPSKL
ncbi:MAG: hypothetical protein EPN25_06180 [Nitrospirae bacterium]|nr:MAG: hypothetical protein EPN25_06180 [Nitrospirota bacterium]